MRDKKIQKMKELLEEICGEKDYTFFQMGIPFLIEKMQQIEDFNPPEFLKEKIKTTKGPLLYKLEMILNLYEQSLLPGMSPWYYEINPEETLKNSPLLEQIDWLVYRLLYAENCQTFVLTTYPLIKLFFDYPAEVISRLDIAEERTINRIAKIRAKHLLILTKLVSIFPELKKDYEIRP